MRAHPAGPRHGDEPHDSIPRPESTQSALDLDAEIWPASVRRNDSGALEIGGLDVRDLATGFDTPYLALDVEDLQARARDYREAFAADTGDSAGGEANVYYAGKAFLSVAVARWLNEQGLGIDVCTGGELECALRADVPPADLLFHGNNKSDAELRRALEVGVGRIVLDSYEDIARCEYLAAELGVQPKVLIRVTVGVEAHTHEFIATAHEDQKFGFSLASGTALEAVSRVLAVPNLDLVGLHSHIGSQIFVASGFEVAAARLVALLVQIRDEFGVELHELDLGGGLGIKYSAADEPLETKVIAADLRQIVSSQCERAGLAMPHLAFEPGRAIVGPTTMTVYRVGTVKPIELDNGQVRTYVSVDGGMSDNIRTALYDAEYTVTLASRSSDAPLALTRVVGKHCESGDIVVKDCWLPSDLAPSDLLAVAATGAYNRSMASNYNLIPRPPVIAVQDGAARPIIRRETLDDVFATDLG